MSEIDDLLNTVGISSATQIASRVQEPTEPASTVQSMSSEAFDEVLDELGFNDNSEDTEEIEEQEEVPSSPTPENILEDYRRAVEESNTLSYNPSESSMQDYEVRVDTSVDTSPLDTAIDALTEAITAHRNNTENEIVESVQEEENGYIEPNSPTLLVDATTSRFSGAEWYNGIQKKNVILAGLGGIGSHCCLQLARMNIAKLVLYDDDIVEPANMSGQLYGIDDVGVSKVDAMVNVITNYTSMRNVYAIRDKFTPNSEAGDIMICGFDNMTARKAFFKAWYDHVLSKPEEERKNCLFIDGRLDISMLQVLCIRGDDGYNIARYQKEFLFSDYSAENTVCSMKQTTYLACMIGSVMVNLFINWVAGLLNPILPYDLPFFTVYDAQNMLFNTEN